MKQLVPQVFALLFVLHLAHRPLFRMHYIHLSFLSNTLLAYWLKCRSPACTSVRTTTKPGKLLKAVTSCTHQFSPWLKRMRTLIDTEYWNSFQVFRTSRKFRVYVSYVASRDSNHQHANKIKVMPRQSRLETKRNYIFEKIKTHLDAREARGYTFSDQLTRNMRVKI